MAERIVTTYCVDCNIECDKTIPPKKRCDDCNKKHKKLYMQQWKQNNQDKVKAQNEKWLAKLRLKTKTTPIEERRSSGQCRICGKTFVKLSAAAKMCSDKCRNENTRLWIASRKKEGRSFKPISCSSCFAVFTPNGSRQRRCSSCQKNFNLEKTRKWRDCNRDHLSEYWKKQTETGYSKKKAMKYREANRGKLLEKARAYYALNREWLVKQATSRNLKKRRTNLRYRLEHGIGGSIRKEMKRRLVTKNKRTMQYTGLTANDLLLYLLSHERNDGSFTEENYGTVWHVDHVRPLASFSDDELESAWHYTNLQPLRCTENISKSSKWNGKKYYRKELTSAHIA